MMLETNSIFPLGVFTCRICSDVRPGMIFLALIPFGACLISSNVSPVAETDFLR